MPMTVATWYCSMIDNGLILTPQGEVGSTHPRHLLDEAAAVEVGVESDIAGRGLVSIEGGTGGDLGPGSAVVAVLAVHHTSESGINPHIKTLLLPLAYRGEYNSTLFGS